MQENIEQAHKKCTDCEKFKPLIDFYSRKARNKSRGEYMYYNPQCKECSIIRSKKWADNNPEKFQAYQRERYQRDRETLIERKRKWRIVNKEKEQISQKEWRENNRDKMRQYSIHRYSNKQHTIPEDEWIRCKDYFNFQCAYCGLGEVEHRNLYKQQLHKEHVIHDGRDDIKNCVPSCKSCNGSKHLKTLNEWYNTSNVSYTYERYSKIYQWIRYDCKQMF